MKIYIVTTVPFPNGMASAKRILNYSKGLLSKGMDCEVIVYTRTERYGIKPNNTLGQGVVEGIKYRYIKGTPLRESNVVLRALNDFYDNIRLIKYLKSNLKFGDIVLCYDTPNIFTKRIIKIVHSVGAKYVRELCELPFGTTIESDKNKKKRKKFERSIMPLFDGVIAISDALVDYAKEYCNTSCLITKVPILVDFEKYCIKPKSKEENIPYIFHCGTLSQQKDGFLDMLKAFGLAAKELPFDVRLYSTGKVEGSRYEAEIKDILKEFDIQDKVIFLGYISDEEIGSWLSQAKFVIINKKTTLQNKYCFATKLGEYMAAGKAIITTQVGEAMNWLTHGRDSFIICPDNVELLSCAISKLFKDEVLCLKIGSQARKTCEEKFSIRANADQLNYFMAALSSNNHQGH